jgi:aspartate/methionine/tyrosine aminotransferase
VFASRLRQGADRNRIALALDERRATGRPIIDLTLSNPTRANFCYPPNLLTPLAHERGLEYTPTPFGLPSARQAVSDDFARRGVTIPPRQIVMTSSTSEAYAWLLKLMCDPGDAVLAPRPSYPLVEHLADLDAVKLVSYSLEFHGRWSIDVNSVREALELRGDGRSRVRAIILISPNNPTGSVLSPADLQAMEALARDRDVALILDEVFADYAFTDLQVPDTRDALTFRLGGLSKTVGLPQLKLGWIGVSGPPVLVDDALERLETISDAYLSVSTPVQAACAEFLRDGAAVRHQIQTRIRRNLDELTSVVTNHPACSLLRPDGGWSAVVQVPALRSEETLVLDLLEQTGILVHPGYFFDFEREAFIVMSLLPEPAVFDPAVARLFDAVGAS